MKVKAILLTFFLISMLLTACGRSKDSAVDKTTPTPAPTGALQNTTTPAATTPPVATTPPAATKAPTDAVTTASIVNEPDAFVQAISAKGTWIIATLNDLSIDKDLTLDGEFTNGKKDTAGKDMIQRKIALYTQDANRNITNRFTLTAPSLTINSPEASIQHGTFVGDLYVNTPNFKLVDATVEGNVYFKDAQIQSSFAMDDTSKITGKKEVKTR